MELALLSVGFDATPSTAAADTFARAGAKIQGTAQRIEADVKRLGASMREIGQGLQSAGTTLTAAITAPLVLLGAAAVKSARDMDSLTRGLTAVMKSSSAASQELKNLREVAKLPGLGFKEAVQGSINLQAAGFSAELARRSLSAFGNALATVGKGKAELDGVNLALSQIASKGKISAEEINQIAERVPQIRKVTEAAFGTSNTEVLQKRGISSTEFVTKIVAELEKLPKVTGGIQNTFENLSDTIQQALVPVGNAILRVLIPAIEAITPYIEKASEAFAKLSPMTQTIIVAMAGIAAAIGPVLVIIGTLTASIGSIITFFGTLGVSGAGAFAFLTGIGEVMAVVAVAAAALYAAWQTNFGGIREITQDVFGFLKESSESVVKFFQENWPLIGAAAKNVLETLKPLFQFWSNNIKAVWNAVWPVLTEAVRTFGTVVGGVFQAILALLADKPDAFRKIVSNTFAATWKGIQAITINGMIAIVGAVESGIKSLLGLLPLSKSVGAGLANAIMLAMATAIRLMAPGIYGALEYILSAAERRIAAVKGAAASVGGSRAFQVYENNTGPSAMWAGDAARTAGEKLEKDRLDAQFRGIGGGGGGGGSRAKELSEEQKLLKSIVELEKQRDSFGSAKVVGLLDRKADIEQQVKDAEKILELRREIKKLDNIPQIPALSGALPTSEKEISTLLRATEAVKSFFESRKKQSEVQINENIAPSVAALSEELKAQIKAADDSAAAFARYSDRLDAIIDGTRELTEAQRVQREIDRNPQLDENSRALLELKMQKAQVAEIAATYEKYSSQIDGVLQKSERLTELEKLQAIILKDKNLSEEKRTDLLDQIIKAEESQALNRQLEATQRRIREFADASRQILKDAFYDGIVDGPKAFFQTLLKGFSSLLAQLASELLTSAFLKLFRQVFNLQGGATGSAQSSGGGGFWSTLLNIGGQVLGSLLGGGASGGGAFGGSVAGGGAGFATGGEVMRSGVYNVGELGRERVYLPRGAYVENNRETSRGGGSTVINATFNLPNVKDAQMFRKSKAQLAAEMTALGAEAQRNA